MESKNVAKKILLTRTGQNALLIRPYASENKSMDVKSLNTEVSRYKTVRQEVGTSIYCDGRINWK